MQSVIRIGSRKSALAVIQAEIIKSTIERHHPEIKIELVTMKTTGDKILDKSLELIGGKGLFVKELDKALLEGQIDLSVHSLKDMPMEVPEELPLLAYGQREDPRDALIFRPGLSALPEEPLVGTSSRRRLLQMKKLYPGCTFQGIRGNVQTRLKKLSREGYDATILAAAGLKRLDMEMVIGRIFSTKEMIPAAGQGILAVQGRRGENHYYLDCADNSISKAQALAEREFVAALGGGCTAPTAAYAKVCGNELQLTGLYYREEVDVCFTAAKTGCLERARSLGAALAEEMKRRH